MGSIWKCSAGALQGLHGHQPVLGFGEAHYVKNSSHHTLDRRFGLCFGSRVSRRTIRSGIPQFEGVTGGHNSAFIPGCWSMGWSQRFPFMTTTTHAYDNINSPKSIRLDNSEEDTEFAEKSRRATAFQDFGTDGDEPFGNGDYRRLSRGDDEDDSKPSDLFREERDGDDGVWADAVVARDDDEDVDDGDEVTSSDGYGSWDIPNGTGTSSSVGSAADSLAIGGKEPVYQVLEVHPGGDVVQREVSRRQLLRSIAGLRLRDIRSVDPSLWVTNAVPAILVRDQAILLNLGSLRAIATSQSVLIFEHKSIGAEAFMGALLPRLRTASNSNSPIMPFELEVVEAALISRTQRLERMLMDVEPRVMASLKVLPIRYTGDVLEELRLGKQALVELAAKAGALRQMLLEMLEHPEDIRKMTIMGRTCKVRRKDGSIECTIPLDKQTAEDEEEEIEMLLEYYLQRCDSCHGQAEKLLDAAKEMEDSIGVNLSSRRLEVSRLELLLQVATFCSALGALVAGIFGMNLKSYLEERALAFYITTGGIVFGGIALYLIMFKYLKARKIL